MNFWNALLQPLKDVREEFTLVQKWQRIDEYRPNWMPLVDFSEEKGCLIDVGCHYGLASAYYIQKTGAKAYGFDINSRVNRLLKQKLHSTPFDEKFIVMGHGLSNENKIVQSYRDTKYSGAGTVQEEQVVLAERMLQLHLKKDEMVTVKRLDDILIPERIAYIKIDCEGNENNVLLGAKETIQKNLPIIIFEALTNDKLQECTATLKKMNYGVKKIDERNFIARREST